MGYSLDLAGVQLVKEEEMLTRQNILDAFARWGKGTPSEEMINGYLNKTWADIDGDLLDWNVKDRNALETALNKANDALAKAQQTPIPVPVSSIPQASLDQIAQTSTDVSWIRSLLNKIFK